MNDEFWTMNLPRILFLCSSQPYDCFIQAGSNDCRKGEEYDVKEIHIHEDYVPGSTLHDIAILKLDTPLVFDENIQSIALQPKNQTIPSETTVIAIGCGLTNFQLESLPSVLQKINLTIIDNDICSYLFNEKIPKGMICTNSPGKGLWYGDSGGPLVANNKLIGILSWIVVTEDGNNNNYYSVSTNISEYYDFIEKYACGESEIGKITEY